MKAHIKTTAILAAALLSFAACPIPPDLPRDARGRIARSASAKAQFKQAHPCPANGQRRGACPGYVIDHVVPLHCGGPDTIDNMQWLTVEDAKRKDRVIR
jgi:hypothetical protein